MNGNLIVKNASELVTCSGFTLKKGQEMSDLKIIPDGAVVIREGIIEAVGEIAEMQPRGGDMRLRIRTGKLPLIHLRHLRPHS